MKKIYVVCCNGRINCDAYDTIDKAIEFIESRNDHPKQSLGWLWLSDISDNQYTIHEVIVK